MNDRQIHALKATGKVESYKVEEGLFLTMTKRGSKSWVFRYRVDGKPTKCGLGPFPEFDVQAAKQRASEERAALVRGVRPLGVRKAREVEYDRTLRGVVLGWMSHSRTIWKRDSAYNEARGRLELLLDRIGDRHVSEITTATLVSNIEDLWWPNSPTVAKRVAKHLVKAFDWGMGRDRVPQGHNPAERITLAPRPRKARLQPAITQIEPLRELLRILEEQDASLTTRLLPRFQALTATRPSEAREASWSEFDLDEAVWTIPAERMKMDRPHLVPLTPGAMAILRLMRARRPNAQYVFQQITNCAPAPHTAMNQAIARAGYGGIHCPHGWRSSFSTIMNTRDIRDSVYIEVALAHLVKGPKGLYDRSVHLDNRRVLMEQWEKLLLKGALSLEEMAAVNRLPVPRVAKAA